MQKLLLQIILIAILPLQMHGQALVQVIHNSADPTIFLNDVWMDNSVFFDDAIFRSATSFQAVFAGTYDVSVTNSSSVDTTNALFRKSFTFVDGEKYILTMCGLMSPTGYNPYQPFDIVNLPMAKDSAANAGDIELLFFQGTTDGASMDVDVLGNGVVHNDVAYANYDGYAPLATSDYTVFVTNSAGTVTHGAYLLPATSFGLTGNAITLLTSGFLDPSMNNSGAAFGLYAALSVGGGLLQLPVVTAVNENNESLDELVLYPNPAQNDLHMNLSLNHSSDIDVEIFNLLGAKIYETSFSNVRKGKSHLLIDVSELTSGVYFCKLRSGMAVETRKIEIRK